jgi:hypothetical protein
MLALSCEGSRFESWHEQHLFRVAVEEVQELNSTMPWWIAGLNKEALGKPMKGISSQE